VVSSYVVSILVVICRYSLVVRFSVFRSLVVSYLTVSNLVVSILVVISHVFNNVVVRYLVPNSPWLAILWYSVQW
jgi:hypothetical protein